MKIDCTAAQALISAAADGELTLQEQKELQAHLAACPGCRTVYAQTMAIRAAFAQWAEEEPELPGDLTAAVMTQVRKESSRRAKTRRRPYLSAALAAACCALMVLGYQMLPRSGGGTDSLAVSSKAMNESAVYSDMGTPEEAPSPDAQFSNGAPEAAKDDAMPEDVALIEGVLTYFRASPEKMNVCDGAQTAADTISIPALSSSDQALLEQMNLCFPETGYTALDEEGGAAATAWLITEAQYADLNGWLEENGVAYALDQADVQASSAGQAGRDLVCVIYLPSP